MAKQPSPAAEALQAVTEQAQRIEAEAYRRGYVQGVCDAVNLAITKRDEWHRLRTTIAWAAAKDIIEVQSALLPPGRATIVEA